MRRLPLAAALLLFAAGCATSSYGPMGYAVVDDEEDGCSFHYGSSYYYQAGGIGSPARLQVVRVDSLRVPRFLDRGDASTAGGAFLHGSADGSASNPAAPAVERASVAPPAPPPPPRAVGPRD